MRDSHHRTMTRSGVDLDSLSVLQRIFLTTDGTVTDILEAYYREPMEIRVQQQHVVSAESLAPEDRVWLGWEAPKGEALKREIALHGKKSGECRLFADSVVAMDRLPPLLRDGLLEKRLPIGHLLLDHRIPTFKELVDCRREPARGLAHLFGVDDDASILSRTYVLWVADAPAMLITEKLPAITAPRSAYASRSSSRLRAALPASQLT